MPDRKLSTVLDAASTSRAAKQARANLARLRSELATLKARHEPAEKINYLEAEGRLAVQRALRAAHAQERQALQVELDAERKRWEAAYLKDYALHAFELQNLERRLRVMGDTELQETVVKVMGGDLVVGDPNGLDVLLQEAQKRGTAAEPLAKGIKEKGLRNLWEKTPAGADLVKQIRLTDDVEGSGVMAVDAQGRWFAQSMDALWEMELEKGEPGNEQA